MTSLSRRATILGVLAGACASCLPIGSAVARVSPDRPPGATADGRPSYPRDVDLLSWNLDLHTPESPEPLARANRMLELLEPHDVLALSGVTARRARVVLARELGLSHPHLVAGPSPAGERIGVRKVAAEISGRRRERALRSLAMRAPESGLMIASKHPIVAASGRAFDAQGRDDGPHAAVLHAGLRIPAQPGEFGTTELDLFVARLERGERPESVHTRGQQLAELERFVRERARPRASTIITGTLHVRGDYVAMLDALPGFADLWETVGSGGRGATYDGDGNLLVPDEGVGARLDFTLFRPGPESEAVAAEMPTFARRWWTPPCEEARRLRRDGRFHLSAHHPLRTHLRLA